MTQTIEQLTARVRELEEENERLKRTNSSYANLTKAQESQLTNLRQRLYQLNGADSAIDSERQANCELTEQLAAEQLNNKLLRDALEFLNARIVTMDLGGVVERALSLPPSTEALDAYVAAKVKEAGKFDMWKINPYTKVLETSIKQLTKQRDLAVEALEKIAKKCNLDMHGDDGSLGGYAYGIWNTANSTLSSIKESEAK